MITSSYVALDLETSGLNPKTDKIIEIGAVKILKGKEVDRYVTFVNPQMGLSEAVRDLTGITDQQLKGGRETEEAVGELIGFIGGLPLLGHRILFDYSFVKKAAVNMDMGFEAEGLDTLKIARKYLPELESRKLSCLCEYYGIPHTAHRALGDAAATHLLYEIFCREFSEGEGCETELFMPSRLRFQVKKESPAGKRQKDKLYELMNRHKLVTDVNIDKLTRNEVSRYTDRILAKYGR